MHADHSKESTQLREVRKALQAYIYAVEQLPYPGCYRAFHSEFGELVAKDFHIRGKPWLNPYELADVVNYVALFGTTKRNYRQSFNVSNALNSLKKLWSLAEKENEYSENVDYIACFLLRWIYQQLPYCVTPDRVGRTCELTNTLLSATDTSGFVESSVGLTGKALSHTCSFLLAALRERGMYTESLLAKQSSPSDLKIALRLLAADRPHRKAFHRDKLEVDSPIEKPYEINSLLRYPILKYESEYYAPYPELIGYASSRGLFFRFSEEGGEAFRRPFSRSFEDLTAQLMRQAMPDAIILTEEDERALGWRGKTNDVSVITGDTALLVECKLSGVFVNAKRTASPDAIIADIRRHLADGKKRRGLFQLYDKCDAMRSGTLPPVLMEKYKNVKRSLPVLLLFDAIEHANAAPVLGNIIRDELSSYGAKDFPFQIWHLEELSWLVEFACSSLIEWTAEKFLPKNYAMGLNSFIADKTGRDFLRQNMYMPQGNEKAFRILKKLSEREILERSLSG
jgi:hypothetical protein